MTTAILKSVLTEIADSKVYLPEMSPIYHF